MKQPVNFPRLILAGTQSSVGKTTFTLGILLAFKKRGLSSQSFKVGPDYIDPGYHTRISGKPCRNLDSRLFTPNVVLELFERQASKADISIIEGVMGLFDGAGPTDQRGSTASIAKILNAPVILILDAKAIAGSAAAIVMGYKMFDKKVNLAGVLLNRIGSQNHYRLIKEAIEKRLNIPVLGYLPKDSRLKIPERHLGILPTQEKKAINPYLKGLSDYVEEFVDVEAILRIAKTATSIPGFKKSIFIEKPLSPGVTIAIARDKAFHFYYEDNLDILKHYGANLIPFSPLEDKELPPCINGIYIGGGFPELFGNKLSRNLSLKEKIRKTAKDGMPIYAECGGLMYLVKKLSDFEGKEFPMAGVLPGKVKMSKKLNGLGYCNINLLQNTILGKKGESVSGHIFHYSRFVSLPKKIFFIYRIDKSGRRFYDGLSKKNVLAGYAHIHFGSNVSWAKNFINSCIEYSKIKKD